MSFGMQSRPETPPPAPIVMPAAPTQADASQFAKASRAAGGLGGLASTIKTSPQGIMGQAPRAAKTFLGE